MIIYTSEKKKIFLYDNYNIEHNIIFKCRQVQWSMDEKAFIRRITISKINELDIYWVFLFVSY